MKDAELARSLLSERTNSIGEQTSEPIDVVSWVRQASFLGSALLILYIKDLLLQLWNKSEN